MIETENRIVNGRMAQFKRGKLAKVGKKNAMRRASHGMKKVRKRRESVHTQIDLIGRQLQAVEIGRAHV